jgi:hypothetical protein
LATCQMNKMRARGFEPQYNGIKICCRRLIPKTSYEFWSCRHADRVPERLLAQTNGERSSDSGAWRSRGRGISSRPDSRVENTGYAFETVIQHLGGPRRKDWPFGRIGACVVRAGGCAPRLNWPPRRCPPSGARLSEGPGLARLSSRRRARTCPSNLPRTNSLC